MNANPSNKFIPVTKWNEFHPWPTQAGLRYLIFNAKTNGFDAVIHRAGRRILIDEQAFFAWLKKQKGAVLNGAQK